MLAEYYARMDEMYKIKLGLIIYLPLTSNHSSHALLKPISILTYIRMYARAGVILNMERKSFTNHGTYFIDIPEHQVS